MTATGFVSAWISNTATTLLMLPIEVAVITQTSNSPLLNSRKKEMFATCIMLSIAYSASLGGIATLLGTPPNAIFASLAQSLSVVEVTFTQWMFVAAPISAVSLFVVWWYLTNFGAKVKDIPPLIEGKDGVASELAKLGRMTRNEKAVMAVFAATATAWISRGLVWKDALPMVGDSTIAIVAAISLFIIRFPPVKKQSKSEIVKGYEFEEADHNNDTGALLDWRTAVKIPWGVLILIGGGLALSNAFASTQLDDWIAGQLRFLDGAPLIIIILAIVTVTVFTGVIISNTATAALFIPVTASLADSLGVSPVYFMVPVTIAASYCFILPAGTPPNAIVFSTGHVTAARMARAGIVAALVGVGIVTVLTSILVPLVWG